MTEKVLKEHHKSQQAMLGPNVWRAFHGLGLEFDRRTEPYRLVFNEVGCVLKIRRLGGSYIAKHTNRIKGVLKRWSRDVWA
jgi:hypothetical protein